VRFKWYRVVWNILWVIPAFVFGFFFAICIAMNKLSIKEGIEWFQEELL